MIYGRPHNCCNEHHIPLLARHRVAPHSNACSKQYSDKKVWSKASVKSSRALYESMNKEEKIRMEISHVARHQELDKLNYNDARFFYLGALAVILSLLAILQNISS